MEKLRLPKQLEDGSGAAELAGALAARARPLWTGGELGVPHADIGRDLDEALKRALSAGRVVRGLENAERALATEAQGQKHVDRKTGVERGRRVSRLIVLADDGAERFYRRVESLLRRHGPRVLAVRLSVDERALGQLLFGPEQVARLLLIEHKDAVATVLLALAAQWSEPSVSDGD